MTANRKISFFLKKTPLLSECGGIMVSYCDIYKCWSQDFSIWRWRNLGSKKTDKKRIQYFWSSPPTSALQAPAPAARAGGKAGGSVLMIVCM